MMNYELLITYSFDADYVSVPCETEDEAIEAMKEDIRRERAIIKEEHGYVPKVLNISETEKYLVYCPEDENPETVDVDDWKSYLTEDFTVYMVIETGHNSERNKGCTKPCVNTHSLCTDILEVFEDFLEEHNAKIPCKDKEEEKERGEDNSAMIYGSEYFNLFDEIENLVAEALEKKGIKTNQEPFQVSDTH